MKKFNANISVTPDNLVIDEVRKWSLEKFRLVGNYCNIFTNGMKYKWNQLVYIDLFAGSGYVKIKETGEFYLNSAIVAMSIHTPFTKYILCEQDEERCNALTTRIKRDFSHLNCTVIRGDSNLNVQSILSEIPRYSKSNKVLSFCFVDPYNLNFSFSTINELGKSIMDFLILQALHMDGNRNVEKYLHDENTRIADYLGLPEWREQFENNGIVNKKDIVKFLAYSYQSQMEKLGYKSEMNMHQIRSNDKNLPLYYLAFYSKHDKGHKFFQEVEKRVNSQLSLEL